MDTLTLDSKRIEAIMEIIGIDNETLLAETVTYIRQAKKRISKQTSVVPPEGFMTGDEFESRVKERVTKFYEEHGLL